MTKPCWERYSGQIDSWPISVSPVPRNFGVSYIQTAHAARVDAGPKSDTEALEIGVKKFDAMVRNHNSERSSFGTDSEP